MTATSALLGGTPAVSATLPAWPLVDSEALAEITRVITEETPCPVAEELAHVEFQVGGNYYVDSPELMAEIAAAFHKVSENADALRAHFDATSAYGSVRQQ